MNYEKSIYDCREVLKPTPVKRQHIPRWFRKASKNLMTSAPDWLDHWGSTTLPNGKQAFVSEPYQLSLESHIECCKLAEAHAMDFSIHSNSWHYPGWTIRLAFTQKEPT